MRPLILIHRWLGVALCVLFLVWFLSGIGIMYFPFPEVTPADRLARSPALDPSTITLSPSEAAARAGIEVNAGTTRLNTFDGRPVYRFAGGRRGDRVVFADTGEEPVATREMKDRVAAAWTGKPIADATMVSVEAVDQWTVQAPLRTLRPLFKYSWPDGEDVYVSDRGEVVQHTTRSSRLGAYLGPIPHWFYFTPLRVRQSEWSATVIWTSGIGTVSAILGIIIGVWMWSPSRQYRRDGAPAAFPYRGQKRWHAILGLVFGVATVTWAFSGLLSMDPFPTSTGGQASGARSGPSVPQALRGRVDAAAFDAKHPREALEQLRGLSVKEIELASFAGEAVYLARLEDGTSRIVPMAGEPRPAFDINRIVEVIKATAPDRMETRILTQYDRYYLDRMRGRPLPVVLALTHDEAGTRYYIDPATARVVGSYSSDAWVSRWLYNGLHSLNFPWLYNHRPLWDIVVIAFMLGGAALSTTSLILAWQVMGRTILKLRNLGA